MKTAISTTLALLLCAATAAPQLEAIKSFERIGDGQPVCGLGKDFHAGRRALLRERVEDGLLLFRGLPETRDYVRFTQDKVFWYLTGVESPGAALLMDAKSGREILFLPEKQAWKESWDGEMWDAGDEWVKELTGFDEVLPEGELEDTLKKLMKKEKTVWISTEPYVALSGCYDQAGPYDKRIAEDPFDGRPSREDALAAVLDDEFKAKVEDVTPILSEMRRVKTHQEIQAMRRAGRAGGIAMAEAMRSSRPGIGEWDLEAVMNLVQKREGAVGPAYLAIVGGGANSNVLHYGANTKYVSGGEIILIDYGPEVDHYTTDITRTWPANGKFSERQAELYDVVLEAQLAGIAAVKPGVTMGEISKVCDAVYKKHRMQKLKKHGPCHYIGLEVHDVGKGGAPFVPGVAFTVEPGLYDTEAGVGVRIEDVVVVTEDGCEVLTPEAPKERAEIEALVAEEGVLDWMDANDDPFHRFTGGQ